MQFRTQISIPKSNFPIDYNSRIMSLGSCFAENMAEKFDYVKFENSCNPFGIIFNPVSIEKIVSRIVNQDFYTEKDIFFHNEQWHCFDVHSDLSRSNKEEFLENLNAILKSTNQQITKSTHIIITYGTSWVYRNRTNNEIVANCHKLPQAAFSKEIVPIETIEKSIQNTINLIQKINPNATFIFTVSPVRHLKDGFVENQVSKAHLITAIYHILNIPLGVPPSGAEGAYFPSYEIMMDELRDYRFYAEDMLHPSPVAINYIWERFSETNLSEESRAIMEEVESIQKGLAHRPFHPNSEKHKKFLENLNQKMNTLASKFPKIKF